MTATAFTASTDLASDPELRRMALAMRGVVEDPYLVPFPHEIDWSNPGSRLTLYLYAAQDARKIGMTAQFIEEQAEAYPESLRGFTRVLLER